MFILSIDMDREDKKKVMNKKYHLARMVEELKIVGNIFEQYCGSIPC